MTAATPATDESRSAAAMIVTHWFPLAGPIGAWTVHLLSLAAFVRYSCNVDGAVWFLHAITGTCLATAAFGLVLALRLVARSPSGRDDAMDDDEASVGGRHLFLGRLAAISAVANILLIAAEGLYVVVLQGPRCG